MIEFEDRTQEIIEKNQHLFDLLYKENNIRKYILGRNPCADSALFSLKEKITAIIDDFYPEKTYKGFNVLKTQDIPKEALVIVGSIATRPLSAIRNLKQAGIKYILDYYALCLYKPESFRMVDFWGNNRKDIKTNFDKYQWLYGKLEDEESKKQLKRLIDFRYNFDIKAMEGFEFKPSSQYFDEKFIEFSQNEVFVDGGGYCGESSVEFIKRCPEYKKIFFFEPSDEQLLKAKEILKNEKITYYKNALFSENKILKFDTENDTANKIAETGKIEIEAVALDKVINEPVTFLKMDIEGAETEALRGAKRLITEYKPKLAICVYHNQSDYWKVPQIILSYNTDYKIYLRHYTEGVLETVMYFI